MKLIGRGFETKEMVAHIGVGQVCLSQKEFSLHNSLMRIYNWPITGKSFCQIFTPAGSN